MMNLSIEDIKKINFTKGDGLVPAVVQDATSGRVLMLGYMNEASVRSTFEQNLVTFYSRSKQRLWTKGETSGHHLTFKNMRLDCDQDALLVQAHATGPVCHTGESTCFGDDYSGISFLTRLEEIVNQRFNHPTDQSYTSSLFRAGLDKIAQKVGEEAVEVIIEAKNENKELFLGEVADLTYHLLVLLKKKGILLEEVVERLQTRHK